MKQFADQEQHKTLTNPTTKKTTLRTLTKNQIKQKIYRCNIKPKKKKIHKGSQILILETFQSLSCSCSNQNPNCVHKQKERKKERKNSNTPKKNSQTT